MFHTKQWFYVQVVFEYILQPFCSLHLNPLRQYDNFIGEHIGIFKYVSNRHFVLQFRVVFKLKVGETGRWPSYTIHKKQTNKQTKQKQTLYCILIDRRRKLRLLLFPTVLYWNKFFF